MASAGVPEPSLCKMLATCGHDAGVALLGATSFCFCVAALAACVHITEEDMCTDGMRSKAVAGGVLLQVRPGVLRVWKISTSSLSLDGMTTLAGLDLVVRPLGLGRVRGMILAVVCVCWLCCWPAPLVPGVGLWPPWLRGSSDA